VSVQFGFKFIGCWIKWMGFSGLTRLRVIPVSCILASLV